MVEAQQISEQGIIDAHYAAIAAVGMERDMRKLGLEEVNENFSVYGKSVEDAMNSGELCSAVTAMEVSWSALRQEFSMIFVAEILDVDPSELLKRCLAAGYEKLRPV